jgi:hypothetical protein
MRWTKDNFVDILKSACRLRFRDWSNAPYRINVVMHGDPTNHQSRGVKELYDALEYARHHLQARVRISALWLLKHGKEHIFDEPISPKTTNNVWDFTLHVTVGEYMLQTVRVVHQRSWLRDVCTSAMYGRYFEVPKDTPDLLDHCRENVQAFSRHCDAPVQGVFVTHPKSDVYMGIGLEGCSLEWSGKRYRRNLIDAGRIAVTTPDLAGFIPTTLDAVSILCDEFAEEMIFLRMDPIEAYDYAEGLLAAAVDGGIFRNTKKDRNSSSVLILTPSAESIDEFDFQACVFEAAVSNNS